MVLDPTMVVFRVTRAVPSVLADLFVGRARAPPAWRQHQLGDTFNSAVRNVRHCGRSHSYETPDIKK